MIAYLIDSRAKTVTPVSVRSWRDICPLIEAGYSPFTVAATFANGDTLYVDDEGFCKPPGDRGYFSIPCVQPQPLCGNGLLLGSDLRGNSTDVQTPLPILVARVRWLTQAEAEASLRGTTAQSVVNLDTGEVLHTLLWDELLDNSKRPQ